MADEVDRLEAIREKAHGPDVDWLIEEVERLRMQRFLIVIGGCLALVKGMVVWWVWCYL